MCFDYTNELADVSAGDYFPPEMETGTPGATALIIRSDTGRKLVEGAIKEKYISVEPIDKGNFFMAGFENKKHGGSYQILERLRHGRPTPDFHLPLQPDSMPRDIFLDHPHFKK